MTKEIGLWIDRREAILVILKDGEEEIRHIPSSSSHAGNPQGLIGFTVEDQRDRKYANQLNHYYDEVIAVMQGADAIRIFGLCFGLRLHSIEAGVIIPDLFQVCPGDLPGEHKVITGHIGLRIDGAMLELHLQPTPKLFQVNL